MKPLPSPTRVLWLGISYFLTVVLTACGGGKAAELAPAAPQATVVAPQTPVIRCAP